MKHILLVEDDVLIREELEIILKKAGYQVSKISEFKETSKQILTLKVDLILLDLNLPAENGFEICKNIKEKSDTPILILTSSEQLKDEIYALKLGADEYISKPFRKERLLIRIENILKRYAGRKNLLVKNNLLLDKNTYTLYVDGTSFLIPPNQGKLLEIFLTAENQIISKEKLSLKLWHTTEYIDENALQVNLSRLKKFMNKIGLSYHLKTVRGKGYILMTGKENEI